MSFVMVGCGPVRRWATIYGVGAHECFQVASERVVVLLDPGDEIVTTISEEPTESHLKRCHITCDLAVIRLLHLNSVWEEKVAQLLERVVHRRVEVRRCLSARRAACRRRRPAVCSAA